MDLPANINAAPRVSLKAGQSVFRPGQPCKNYLVVTQGCVRVFARSREGREVVLYRVRSGEMCVLTTSCLLGNTEYPADAVAESDVEARALPAAEFGRMLETSTEFRHFVFESFTQRIADVMRQFAQIVLERTDRRLAIFLLENRDEADEVHKTHESIAIEIGSAREVVSRHLKEMERIGLLQLHRARIRVLDGDKLSSIT